ncbi:type II toxin-antitoxin system RelE/ParE family toxin [Merismopedia glauca]|uniref:Addiction module antitoxin n=1 Tax=Merismopedia glauca CCAP 1448/3 TaxID=1296344 RepID=A0A2T1C5Z3_9CYAN|nr:type II toxin-antitoxin system RelE/ParE family toxin [Merismopedia glauca]PSB03690.1 addiction module antitoxin [Merismopedia glauca CCAP 1448/3]
METDETVQIEYTARFQRDVRTLTKRYRNIRTDLQPLLDRLQTGEILGDRVPGMDYTVFKVRVKNSNIQKGKSAGYRVLYYLKASDRIIMITMYSKSDLSDIPAEEVRDILAEYEN